ncbi:MAG: Maf family protein [Propioniciclava sp.]|uniref:Maf family protein n=1 Tax=Propioniciclava sp. TaxID=2038686 RepID=UPI0039E4F624
MSVRVVLASASPARVSVLRGAGIEPEVIVSGVDESRVEAAEPRELAMELARLKAEAVFASLDAPQDVIVIGCDSILVLDGAVHGKPYTDDVVRARWQAMRGRRGDLITGHHLIVARDGDGVGRTEAALTAVTFADVSDAEIEAYIATGEPHHCAGAFTIDGFGGAFVERLEGDHHNVIGLSVPLLRRMLATVGVEWTGLWNTTEQTGG